MNERRPQLSRLVDNYRVEQAQRLTTAQQKGSERFSWQRFLLYTGIGATLGGFSGQLVGEALPVFVLNNPLTPMAPLTFSLLGLTTITGLGLGALAGWRMSQK